MTTTKTTAIVLAGERGPIDAVAEATGASCKALASVGGRPMLLRVVDALRASHGIGRIRVVGPTATALDANPAVAAELAAADVEWFAPADSPSASALRAVNDLPIGRPVLVTSADHALLSASIIDSFVAGIDDQELAIALVALDTVRAAYPDIRRTVIRLRPGAGYCSANLFALNGANAFGLIDYWQQLEQQRKHPARYLASLLGWPALARYLLGRLTLDQAFNRLSRRTGVRVGSVLLTSADAAVDVDDVDDLAWVESVLAQRNGHR